jgi:quercetin dioxygenase-like cupin family protein
MIAMKFFRFGPQVGRPITAFDSVNVVITPIQRAPGQVQIGCFHIGSQGRVGYHQAVGPQLFLVMQGTGWVRGGSDERMPISAGKAAFWADGEWHESGSESGMTVIVIEGLALDPGQYLTEAREL